MAFPEIGPSCHPAHNFSTSAGRTEQAGPERRSRRPPLITNSEQPPRVSRNHTLTKPFLDSIMSSMNAISYTAARENLASTMDRVCSDHTPVIITRNRDQSVVMLSLEDFEALEETAYLMRSPANAKRLFEAIHALDSGKGVVRDINLNA